MLNAQVFLDLLPKIHLIVTYRSLKVSVKTCRDLLAAKIDAVREFLSVTEGLRKGLEVLSPLVLVAIMHLYLVSNVALILSSSRELAYIVWNNSTIFREKGAT